jgi:hypothetical protein
MNNLIIGFSRSKSPWKIGSQIIQIGEKRNFSHAYIRYKCILTGVDIIAQAGHGYVNEMNFEIFKEHNIVVEEYELICNENQYIDVIKFIRTNLGVDYSTMQIMFLAIKKLLRFEIKVYNKDKQFICSEFAARICEITGIRVPTHLDYFTPSDLNTLIKDIKLKKVY